MISISTGTLVGIITTVMALLLVFAKIVEHTIYYFVRRKRDKDCNIHKRCIFDDAKSQTEARKKIDEIGEKVGKSYDLLMVKDPDGTPMVYFPRHVISDYSTQFERQEKSMDNQLQLQHQMIERMAEITQGQERLAMLLNTIEKSVEKLVDRLEKVL
jgi:hypothetical protein